MNILKYEYKAHRLIKIIFYLISFVLGFLIGVGVKELKINSILCTLLGIENVQAKTLTVDYTDTFTVIRKNYDLDDRLNYLEENFIKLKFNKVFNQYAIIYYSGELYVFLANGTLSTPYIFHFSYTGIGASYYWDFNSNGTGPTGYFKIPLDTDFEKTVSSLSSYDIMSSDWLLNYKPKNAGSMIFFSTGNAGYIYPIPKPSNEYYIPFDVNFPMFLDGSHGIRYSVDMKNTDDVVIKYFDKDYTTKSCYNGHDCLKVDNEIPSYYEYLSEDIGYFKEPEFNENLFANNDNFKEVCVPVNKDFGINFTEGHVYEGTIPGQYTGLAYDFIWFKHGVTGLSTYLYDTESDYHIKEVIPDSTKFLGYSFWLRGKPAINNAWSFGYIGEFLNTPALGYTNKFDFYDYTLYPFVVDYTGYYSYGGYNFSVFRFEEPGIKYIDSDKIDYPSNYCFYIRKDYDVVIFDRDEFGDIYGKVNTPDGVVDVSTSQNRDNFNSDTSSSTILSFITNIGGELGFIKDTVLDFFRSMPTLLQLFILAIFNVLLIKIIIGMVTR